MRKSQVGTTATLLFVVINKLERSSPSKFCSLGPYSFQLRPAAKIYLVTMVNVNPRSSSRLIPSIPQPIPGLVYSLEELDQLIPQTHPQFLQPPSTSKGLQEQKGQPCSVINHLEPLDPHLEPPALETLPELAHPQPVFC